MAKKYEYYVRRTGPKEFEVSKFDSMEGGDQPLATYNITYDSHSQKGKCNCQAATYRGTGSNDKHVGIVRDWITGGERATAIIL